MPHKAISPAYRLLLAGFLLWASPIALAQANTDVLLFPLALDDCSDRGCRLTQDHGDFGSNSDSPNNYHFGIDISAQLGNPVYTVAEGKIVLVSFNDPKPSDRCKNQKRGCSDHGLGNTIVIRNDYKGKEIFTLYSHMGRISNEICSLINDIDKSIGGAGEKNFTNSACENAIKTYKKSYTLKPPVKIGVCFAQKKSCIPSNKPIGYVGGTGFGRNDSYVPHLHFEIRRFVGLSYSEQPEFMGSWQDCGWGYGKRRPSECRYVDPLGEVQMIPRPMEGRWTTSKTFQTSPLRFPDARAGVMFLKTMRVTVPKQPVQPSIRWLPVLGNDAKVRAASAGEEFFAVGEVEGTTRPKCSVGWFLIEKIDPNQEFTHERLRGGNPDDPQYPKEITHKRAWICRGDNDEQWVRVEDPYQQLKEPSQQRLLSYRGAAEQLQQGTSELLAAAGGLATALVIDRSGSMKGDKLRKAKAGAAAYVKLLEPSDFASVSSFSKGARTDMSMSSQADARRDIETVLSAIDPVSATNIAAGLERGYLELGGVGTKARKVALLLSDGRHNVGSFESTVQPVVRKFAGKRPAWPIYTIGYGKDADPKTLLDRISTPTGGRYWHADTVDVEDVYCQINADIYNKSNTLSVSDILPPGGEVTQVAYVAPGARNLTFCISWQGSKLLTVLVSPTGRTLGRENLTGSIGRYDEGATYQLLHVYKPQPGRWQIKARWEDPPPIAEQVNITVSEKSDIFGQILGLKSEYHPGEPVTFNVEVAEVVGYQRVPLLDARVRVQVQKPGGTKMVRLIRKRPINLRSAKREVQSATRNVRLHDDGAHNDYRAGDGIFGGTFTETDENGAYLVTATVTGHKRNGQRVQRKLIASFQVGPIAQNPVTTAQILEVRDLLEDRTDPAEAIKALRSDPLAAIKGSQSDPLDAINMLRQGVQ